MHYERYMPLNIQRSPLPQENLRSLVRDVPDFPKPGIMFRDISPLLRQHFGETIQQMAEMFTAAEWQNIDLVHVLCKQMDEKLGREAGTSAKLITYVKDRPGHDLRYAIDASKINKELGYMQS